MLERRASLATTWAGMSRHQIDREHGGHVRRLLLRSGWMAGGVRSAATTGRREVAEAGPSHLEREAEPPRAATGRRDQSRIVGLGEVDEPAVVAEVGRQQLGMAVEAEAR